MECVVPLLTASEPLMVAHRCGGGEAPENTLERALATKFCSGDGMRLSETFVYLNIIEITWHELFCLFMFI
jgi:hypothetical protein